MNAYIKALRAPFLAGSVVPVLIGSAYAFFEGKFVLVPFLVAISGVGALHLAANLFNDYYDARGSDLINIRLNPFSGGSRVIQDGEVKAEIIWVMGVFFLFIAWISAIWLTYKGRPLVFFMGFLGLLAGWIYSAPPLQLMSRGWGEVVIFLAFGPLITLGSNYVMSGDLSLKAFAMGFPQGFLITGVIWINQFPDFEADSKAGKRNLVVRLGPSISRIPYCLIMLLSFASVIFLISLFDMPCLIMITLISLPLAFKAMIIAWREYLSNEGLIPAQALTIQTVMAQGLLLSFSLFLSRFIHV